MNNGAYGTNVEQKTRIIQQKLDESKMKGQKPTIGAIAQGFRPTHESLANTVKASKLLLVAPMKMILHS